MRSSVVCVLVLVACAVACDRGSSHVGEDAQVEPTPDAAYDAEVVEGNHAPVANAGPDAEYLTDTSFSLDGTASTDSDGTIVAYQWTIDTRPAGSTAALTNELAPTATFTADVAGTYTFQLLVTDDDGATDTDTVTIVVPRLVVDAGTDQTVVWHTTVHLAGSFTSDSNPVALAWHFVSRPTSSGAVLQAPSTTTPTFYADKVGTFVVELAATTPAGARADTVTITVVPPPADPIDGNIVDIDIGYGGQLVIASTNPSRIRVVNLVASLPPEVMEIPLTVTPTAIGVSETGEFVSIIHNNTRLTRARIPSLQQLETIDTHTTLLDVRHGTSRPHAYPAQAGSLLLVDYVANKVYTGGAVAGPVRGKQAPTASYPVYVIELGASAKLRRFDGGQQTTPFVRDWPYTAGAYPLGNDLWFLGDSKIVTSSGHIFRMDDDPTLDMTHLMQLDGDQPFDIVGVAAGGGKLVTLATRITTALEPPETQVRFYDYYTLALEHVVPLPDLVVAGVPQPARGLAITGEVFDASHFFVVATAGTSTVIFTVPTP